nr:OprD family porin [Pseudomonas sp. M30-35]
MATGILTLPTLHAHAEFINDSKATVQLRNFYFNSDYRQEAARQSKREEWAQGFIVKYESGYTAGTVGFGLDAIGLLGLKLDSGPDRQNSGLLPVGSHKAPDEYSQLGATAKVRVSNSNLKTGTFIPKLKTVLPSDSRLLPQSFQGTHLTMNEVEGLTFNLGRLTQNSLRNSSSLDDMTVAGSGITGGKATDRFDFTSLEYAWSKNLTTEYNYGFLEGNYKQHIVNSLYTVPLADQRSLTTDLRYAHSSNDEQSNVDNQAFGVLLKYKLKSHGFTAAYQQMEGDTGFPHINGTTSFLVNYVMMSADFANPSERSWQLRYDYDFAGVGLPGLSFMTRYIRGDNFERKGVNAAEWERNTDIAYRIQSGTLKNLEFKWRNGTYRSSGGNDIDQNRLIASYSISLF